MALPHLPWYDKVKSIVAPTEKASETALIIAIILTIIVLLKGNSVTKTALAIYWWSP